MRTIPRAVAAIVGGWILGSVSAIPFGLLILLIDHKAAGEKGVTIPNVAQEVAIGFLTGFFAGLIFERSGKLIGALAQVVPAVMVIALVVSVHHDPSNLLILTGIGLLPAIVGGSYGASARFPKRAVARVFNVAGIILLLVFGFWGLVVSEGIVNKVAGFWGVVIGLTVAPVTLAAAPWYALVAWGSWSPLLICYGGTILSGLLVWAASKVDSSQSWP